MLDPTDPDYLAPRRCFREPVAEIFEAAELLSRAADAHLRGEAGAAAAFITQADMPAVRAWTESLWGSPKINPDQPAYLRVRHVPTAPPILDKPGRAVGRMPTSAQKAEVIKRYGRHCIFCGIPLIRAEVRNAFRAAYPETAYWGSTNLTCHAAFQCMWLQYDHVLPHSRGGVNCTENIVPTCAGCNYGRVSMTLEEVGLLDPRTVGIRQSAWDGLERIFTRAPD